MTDTAELARELRASIEAYDDCDPIFLETIKKAADTIERLTRPAEGDMVMVPRVVCGQARKLLSHTSDGATYSNEELLSVADALKDAMQQHAARPNAHHLQCLCGRCRGKPVPADDPFAAFAIPAAPPAPLDEARMREILAEEAECRGMSQWGQNILSGTDARFLPSGIALAAMSRAISAARAEQRERDARIADRMNSHGRFIAAAIRSQDNPNKQGE